MNQKITTNTTPTLEEFFEVQAQSLCRNPNDYLISYHGILLVFYWCFIGVRLRRTKSFFLFGVDL